MRRVSVFLRTAWFLVFVVLIVGGILSGFALFAGRGHSTNTAAGPTTTPASWAAAPSVILPTTPPLPATPPYRELPTTTVATYVPGMMVAAGTPAAIATRQAMITPTRVRANPTTTPTPAEVLTLMVPGKDFGVTTHGSTTVVSGTWGSGPGQFGKSPQL